MTSHRFNATLAAVGFAALISAGQLLDGPDDAELARMAAADLADAQAQAIADAPKVRYALECIDRQPTETLVAVAAQEGTQQ